MITIDHLYISVKRGWDDKWEYFSDYAHQGQQLKDELLFLVDEDTQAFNNIIDAIRLPKATDTEKAERKSAIETATKNAIDVPLRVMKTAYRNYNLLNVMCDNGNPASVSDVGVGALCTHTAIHGAYLNVIINCKDLKDTEYVNAQLSEAKSILNKSNDTQKDILNRVEAIIEK